MTAFDLNRVDEVIHGRVRLGVMAYLSSAGKASFVELKAATGATDGNLSAQIRKLEDAGYLEIAKTFQDRKPLTTASLTEDGRAAWMAYLSQMQALIDAEPPPTPRTPG